MKTWVALLPVVVLLIAGCGGGNDDPSSAATSGASSDQLTKAELIEQGDAICAKVFAVTETLHSEGTREEAVHFANLHLSMVKDLLSLGVPQETEYAYAEYTNAAHALAGSEVEVKLAAERNDPAALRVVESSSLSTFSLFQVQAGAYGFKECAEGER